MSFTTPLLPVTMMTTMLSAAVATHAADRFDLDKGMAARDWQVVVDGVMGGRSTGGVSVTGGDVLRFAGDLSLENNGGFSQIRREVRGSEFQGADGIEITVRGDGRTYLFDVRATNARVMAGGFQQEFTTTDGTWTTVRLPFDGFRLFSFGRPVPGEPALDPARIESIGITLADKKPGSFEIEVERIRAVSAWDAIAAKTKTAGNSNDTKTMIAADGDQTNLRALSRSSALDTLAALTAADDDDRTDTPRTKDPRTEALRLCELAIERGVPLFNAGQPAGCAAVYEVTIAAMAALGGKDLAPEIVNRLEQGLAEAKGDDDWTTRAWTYRRTLDDVYAKLSDAHAGTGQTASR